MRLLRFNEHSFFHDEDFINTILDKVSSIGYDKLNDSEKLILNNYSNDDADIKALLTYMHEITDKFKELNKNIEQAYKTDNMEYLSTLQKEWSRLNTIQSNNEIRLRHDFKIADVRHIWDFEKKFMNYPPYKSS